MKDPTGANKEYFIPECTPLVASRAPPMYTSKDAIQAITKITNDESPALRKIIEYTNSGNGMKSKNNTANVLPIAVFAFCR
jgi:hypothetical protein